MRDEERDIRAESIAIIDTLINGDTVLEEAKVLEEYRQRFGENNSCFLKHGLSDLFVSDLLSKCRPNQRRQVSYLLDEHRRTQQA